MLETVKAVAAQTGEVSSDTYVASTNIVIPKGELIEPLAIKVKAGPWWHSFTVASPGGPSFFIKIQWLSGVSGRK